MTRGVSPQLRPHGVAVTLLERPKNEVLDTDACREALQDALSRRSSASVLEALSAMAGCEHLSIEQKLDVVLSCASAVREVAKCNGRRMIRAWLDGILSFASPDELSRDDARKLEAVLAEVVPWYGKKWLSRDEPLPPGCTVHQGVRLLQARLDVDLLQSCRFDNAGWNQWANGFQDSLRRLGVLQQPRERPAVLLTQSAEWAIVMLKAVQECHGLPEPVRASLAALLVQRLIFTAYTAAGSALCEAATAIVRGFAREPQLLPPLVCDRILDIKDCAVLLLGQTPRLDDVVALMNKLPNVLTYLMIGKTTTDEFRHGVLLALCEAPQWQKLNEDARLRWQAESMCYVTQWLATSRGDVTPQVQAIQFALSFRQSELGQLHSGRKRPRPATS